MFTAVFFSSRASLPRLLKNLALAMGKPLRLMYIAIIDN